MIHEILFLTDGSPFSHYAFTYAEQIATANHARVVLVQVIQDPILIDQYQIVPAETYQELLDLGTASATLNIDRLSTRLAAAGVSTSSEILRGNPAAALLALEAKEHPDLVVMSSHGRTGLTRFALGSVADRLVREGTAPVLLVKTNDPDRRLRSALLMLDGSAVAEAALPVVENLAGRPIKVVKLLRTLEDITEWDQAKNYLADVAVRLEKTGLLTELILRVSDPAVIASVESTDVDLVVLATHGRGGFERFRYGSVAEQILHEVDRPILLVRAAKATE